MVPIEHLESRTYMAASGLQYTGQSVPDATIAHDGLIPIAVGVQMFQVVRSAPDNPTQTDGTNFFYRHAPYMAHWNNRFWVYHHGQAALESSGQARLNWSSDGMTWNKADSSAAFPNMTHQRSAFYVTSTNRLLMTTWVGESAATRGELGTRVVREVYGPNNYGPLYAAKYNFKGAWQPGTYPLFSTSADAGFKAGVQEMLDNKLYRQQWQEEDRDPAFYVVNSVEGGTDPAAKAFNWWTAADGKIVAVWKGPHSVIANNWDFGQGITAVKENNVYTQAYPNGHLTSYDQLGLHGTAKIWGQKTESNNYLIVGNAPGIWDRRAPSVITTSTDGKNFNTAYLGLGNDTPPHRYENPTSGDSKGFGAQYFTGITPASGASPGNGNPAGTDTWITFSQNAEDIWIAKIPANVTGVVASNVNDNFNAMALGRNIPNWNTTTPQWGSVSIVDVGTGDRALRLQDSDPVQMSKATRVFPNATGTASVSFRVRPLQANAGRFEVDITSPNGTQPVRLAFDNTGKIFANSGATLSQVGTYAANAWLNVTVNVDVANQRYSLTVDNGTAANTYPNRPFREWASSVERAEFRTGLSTRTDMERRPMRAPWLSTRLAGADTVQTNASFDIDNVVTTSTAATTPVTVDDFDPRVKYSTSPTTGWQRTFNLAAAFDAKRHISYLPGASMEYTFTGTKIDLFGSKSTDRGRFDVFIDGSTTPAATVDTYASSLQNQQLLYSRSGLANGQHTIRIVVRADKNAASTGTGVEVDKLIYTPGTTAAVAQPYGGTAVAIAATGTTNVEAERFDTGGAGVAYADVDAANNGNAFRTTEAVDIGTDAAASGGYNVGWTAAGEWMGYTVNVAQAGQYDVKVRVNSGMTGGGTFRLEFGPVGQVGGTGVTQTATQTAPDTGAWAGNYTEITIPGVNLAAGLQWLRLVEVTGGYNVDRISFTKIATGTTQAPYPAGAPVIGSTPVTIQAEDFDTGGQAVAYNDVTVPNDGGDYRTGERVDVDVSNDAGAGFFVGWTKAGEWLEYTVNVATAGAYTMEFRVASAALGGSFHVEFDGVDKTGSVVIPSTGSWTTWQTISKSVTLAAGTQVMRIAMDSESASTLNIGNFNWVKFTSAAPAPTSLFSDSFTDGNAAGWTPTLGTWAVQSSFAGRSNVYANTGNSSGTTFAGDNAWSDYAVSAWANMDALAVNGGFGLYGRATSDSSGYRMQIARQGDGSMRWFVYKRAASSWTTLGSGAFTYTPGTWVNLRFSFEGTTIKAESSTNGVAYSALGTFTDAGYTTGRIGLFSTGTGISRWDDVLVTQLP